MEHFKDRIIVRTKHLNQYELEIGREFCFILKHSTTAVECRSIFKQRNTKHLTDAPTTAVTRGYYDHYEPLMDFIDH